MTLKNYYKLLFHSIITLLIILSAPIALVILLNNKVADWITIVAAVSSASITIFFGIKYMMFIVYKKDIFKDMF